jgi:MFS superfamily sulfate permease-like transporter
LLVPKLVTTLKTYTRAQLAADLTAGVIVGIVALPLAIAFAIASGLTPERGLYTAVIAGLIIFGCHLPAPWGAEKFKDTLSEVSKKPKVLIIPMRHVPAIDSTAMHALRDLVRRTQRDGTVVFFSDVGTQPLVALERSGLLDEIGQENLFGNIDEALAAAGEVTESPAESGRT